jgi:hypothetical protein
MKREEYAPAISAGVKLVLAGSGLVVLVLLVRHLLATNAIQILCAALLLALIVSPKMRSVAKACISACTEMPQARSVVPAGPVAPMVVDATPLALSPPGPVVLSPIAMATTPPPVQMACFQCSQAFYPPPNASVCACPFCGCHNVLS